jgi:hypothetical protein
MKCLKQRFTIWYNRNHDRFGTFWAERFKSLLVESSEKAIKTVSAYIDLNPVRAGIVNDPADYRFCNYAEAMAGNKLSQAGLKSVLCTKNSKDALTRYRLMLFEKEPFNNDNSKKTAKIDSTIEAPLVIQTLHCKCRYFTDGMILGSREYVDSIFQEYRHFFGPKRKTGARQAKDIEFGTLHVARDLRK